MTVTSTSINKRGSTGRDSEATKARILDAAEEEFARGGLLGARTEAIAANTNVTKAMIYYYFSDKEGLYHAVLERAFARRMQSLRKVDILGKEPKDALRDLMTAYIDEAAKNQHLPAIMFYEGLQNQGRFYGKIAIASLYSPLVEVLERGIAAGQCRENMDPLHVAVNIIGLSVFYFCSMQNIKHLWPGGTDLYGEDMRNAHKREAIEMIVAGVMR